MAVGHARCDDPKFVDVTIDLVLVMFRQGVHMFRNAPLGVGWDVVSTREPPTALLSSERLFGLGR